MKLLNTKALLVIAALLASLLSIAGLVLQHRAQEEQRRAQIEQHEKERWNKVREDQKKLGPMRMEDTIKNHKPY